MLNRKFKPAAHPAPSLPAAHSSKNHSTGTQSPVWTRSLGSQPAPGLAVQRQPKPSTQAKPAKPKTLKDMGISARDPVAKGTPAIIDAVFRRNKTIAPYIADRLNEGRDIAEKGKFVVHKTQPLFEDAYEKYIGKTTNTFPEGFYWETEDSGKTQIVRDEIHLPPDATFGTAFHEAVHKMSALISHYLSDDPDFAFEVNEGLTSWFSKRILEDEGVDDYIDGYAFKRKRADKLIKHAGLDAAAKWYWKNDRADLLKKLGVTANSKDESKQVIKALKKIM